MKLLIKALLALMLAASSINMYAADNCPLLLENDGDHPIFITTDQELADITDAVALEEAGAIALEPDDVGTILSNWIFIYVSKNDQYVRSYTLAQKYCIPRSACTILVSEVIKDGLDKQQFLVIDHEAIAQHDFPEAHLPLCPNGELPVYDEEKEILYCKVNDAYVPVHSYIYSYLPEYWWVRFYGLHPRFYDWYDENPQFWLSWWNRGFMFDLPMYWNFYWNFRWGVKGPWQSWWRAGSNITLFNAPHLSSRPAHGATNTHSLNIRAHQAPKLTPRSIKGSYITLYTPPSTQTMQPANLDSLAKPQQPTPQEINAAKKALGAQPAPAEKKTAKPHILFENTAKPAMHKKDVAVKSTSFKKDSPQKVFC